MAIADDIIVNLDIERDLTPADGILTLDLDVPAVRLAEIARFAVMIDNYLPIEIIQLHWSDTSYTS